MGEKIYNKLDVILPTAGGAGGALSHIHKIVEYFPPWESIACTVVLTVIGAVVGYLIKIILDKIFKK
jgi:hypothetical protein